MGLALEGIKIIDLSRVLAGPFCTMILGDLGAEVIKIEHHQNGDETRYWGPPFVEGESAYYLCANRNKESMTLNLKSEEGKQVFLNLVRDADVVVENFKTGTLEKMSIGYEQLNEVNPKIILASITGFGQSGPYKDLPGYDYIIQAMSGLMNITGEENGAPMKVGVAITDVITGLYTCIGILSALQHRHQTGEGQAIDIALLDCQISSLINVASNYLVGKMEPQRLGNRHPNIAPYQVFTVADGEMVIAVGNDKQFSRFCNTLELPELAIDDRYTSNRSRVENRDSLIPILQQALLKKSKQNWKRLFDEQGIPNGPINTISEMFNDPHVKERQMVIDGNHPHIPDLKLTGSPLKLSKSPVTVRRHPPKYGEQTVAILQRTGYGNEEIQKMKKNHII